MTRPRMLILTVVPVARGPRIVRQVERFGRDYDVTTVGYGPSPSSDVTHIELPATALTSVSGRIQRALFAVLLVLRMHRLAWSIHPKIRSARTAVRASAWDAVIAHDVMASPLAFDVDARARIVDLHEFAPSQGEDRWWWRVTIGPLYRRLCRSYVSRADATITVADGIAAAYERGFGFRPEIITSATDLAQLSPRPTGRTLRLVHSGVAAAARRLDVMIEAVRDSDLDVTLDLLLVDNGSGDLGRLRAHAAADPRIRFVDPVPYSELVARLNEYDVGLAMIAPTTFNLTWCLPNKFFDFVQARLAVVTGPSPEMAAIVRERGLGVVTVDFEAPALRRVLADLDPARVDGFKRASHAAAGELSGEEQMRRLGALVDRVLAQRS